MSNKKQGKNINCRICGKEYYATPKDLRDEKCCSLSCGKKYYWMRTPHKYPRVAGNCEICSKIIVIKNSGFDKPGRRFCSKSCTTVWRNKNIPQSESQRKKTAERNSRLFKGVPKSDEHRLKMREANLGSKSHFWRGGLTDENRKMRNSTFYKNWRRKVWERDNYTCQECKARSCKGRPVYLSAHHIKSWAMYPDLRFDISNGLTLCKDCHKKTNNFASNFRGKNNNYKK